MPDDSPRQRTAENDVELLAVLYAGDLLDKKESAQFEQRIGQDQGAREALARATLQLCEANDAERAVPSQSYRANVRQKLRDRPRRFAFLRFAQNARFRPATAIVIGAVVAILVFVGIGVFTGARPSTDLAPHAAPGSEPGKLRSIQIEAPFEIESASGDDAPSDSAAAPNTTKKS